MNETGEVFLGLRDDNSSGKVTLLHRVLKNGNVEKAMMLINRGSPNGSDCYGITSLMIAVIRGYENVVRNFCAQRNIKDTIDAQESLHGDSALHYAVTMGRYNIVQLLINAGAFVNILNKGYQTPFMVAANKKYEDVLSIFLNNNSTIFNLIDMYSNTALHLSISGGDYNGTLHSIVQSLIDVGVPVNTVNSLGESPLIVAAKNGCADVVKLLLKVGEKEIKLHGKDGYSALYWAIFYNNVEVVKVLIDNNLSIKIINQFRESALVVSAKRGAVDVLKFLLEVCEKDINLCGEDGYHALYWGVFYDNVDIVKILIDAGVPVKTVNCSGENLLTIAAKNESLVVLELLLKVGGNDINLYDKEGCNPLYWAVFHDNVIMAQMLISAGSFINVIYNDERTLLTLAVGENSKKVLKLLIGYELDIDKLDVYNNSTLYYAICYGRYDIVKILLNAGVKVDEHSLTLVQNDSEEYAGILTLFNEYALKSEDSSNSGIFSVISATQESVSIGDGGGARSAETVNAIIDSFETFAMGEVSKGGNET